MAKSITCVKLSTGEELICEFEKGDVCTLHNPIYIQMTPKQDGSGVGLNMSVPFLMYANTRKFNIGLDHIVTFFEPATEVANAYRTNHGSGIAVVAGNTDVAGVAKSLLLG
jgi:hypothetical protein